MGRGQAAKATWMSIVVYLLTMACGVMVAVMIAMTVHDDTWLIILLMIIALGFGVGSTLLASYVYSRLSKEDNQE